MTVLSIAARGISVTLDLTVGHIADFAVEADGRVLRPLHRAPWIDEPDLPGDIKPGLARLSGDFLCAPFSACDVEEGPGHGWPANSPWSVVSSEATADGWRAELRLDRPVMGAAIEKTLTLRDGHPFLYQEHRFIGGHGDLSMAHHVMGAMANGGRVAFSPKRFAMTPPTSLEPDPERGRYMLAYPARAPLEQFPTQDGGETDLRIYRSKDLREDFVILVESDHSGPGWTALAREAEEDMLLVLKNPKAMPITMLWLSNGGRYYAPWNGRHLGVLGIEDGLTAVGHRESISANKLTEEGVPTSFRLMPGRQARFRHVIGALTGNDGEPPAELTTSGGQLIARFAEGPAISAAYDDKFLFKETSG